MVVPVWHLAQLRRAELALRSGHARSDPKRIGGVDQAVTVRVGRIAEMMAAAIDNPLRVFIDGMVIGPGRTEGPRGAMREDGDMTSAPEFETLLVSVEPAADTSNPHAGTLGRLTLNQPEKLNPVGLTPLREIAEAAHWFDQAGAAVVVVSSAGDRAFSSGFDLTEFADSNGKTGSAGSGADLGRRMAESLEGMNALAIAQIQGHCVGGGLVLAAACDLRIAADNAKFSIPEVDLGIPLAWGGIPRMVREIGPAMTKELVLTCRPFTSQEAQAVGFLNRVVAVDTLATEVEDLAQSLLAKAPSLIRTTKRQVRDAVENMASTTIGWTGDAMIAEALGSDDARNAARQYLKSKNKS